MIKLNYLFHFKITENYNDYIKILKKKLVLKTESKVFDHIFNVISKNIPKLKEIIGNHNSEYAFIDKKELQRIDKYIRLNAKNYYKLKKWHYIFNEYGMAAILRDIIKFVYDGIVKYGVDEFVGIISNSLNINKIKHHLNDILTQLLEISTKKACLFSYVIENLSFCT